jgi:hypothetical protein
MFPQPDGTADERLERRREARRRELCALLDQLDRNEQRRAQIARKAADEGDWQTLALLAELAG